MYTNGSNAYQLDWETTSQKRQTSSKRKAAPKRKARRKAQHNNLILGIVCVFVVALTICWGYGRIYGLHNELERKTKELESLQSANAQKTIAISKLIESSKIEAYAMANLGLQKIDSRQQIMLNQTRQDSMRKVGKKQENRAVKGLFGLLSNTAEYSK